ncbi:MAG: NAD-dependent epimerase/dehydratase family protein [Desulfamplus sp.]|nr:NAD-dependent epimerase/dehydratase family protein [Desulfamplus sp.]
MSETILITGGCGFIGINLISLLTKHNKYNIRVLDNETPGKKESLRDSNVDFIKGDIRDKEIVEHALKDTKSVIHLAADTRVMDSIENPSYNFDVNVNGTLTLLSAMEKLGVKRIINASTGGAIAGDIEPPVHESIIPCPASPYGASKLAVEGYLSAFSGSYGFSTTSLRFSNIYGPHSRHKSSVIASFMKSILERKELVIYGDGKQTRDYVYVDDISHGIYLALKNNIRGVFQLGSGIPTSLNTLIDKIRKTVGDDFKFSVRYDDYRKGEVRHTWSDIAKANKLLKYQPEMSLDKGLEMTWEWYKKIYFFHK